MTRLSKEEKRQILDRPPFPKAEVIDVLHNFRKAGKLSRWPEGMPRDFGEAYDWLSEYLLEPPRDDEAPRQATVTGSSEGKRWECPYNRRLVSCVVNYVLLSRMDQQFVLAAREDKVYWRGDPIWVFSKIVNETMEMRKVGVEEYKKQTQVEQRRTGYERM